jgi:hypothetical protein
MTKKYQSKYWNGKGRCQDLYNCYRETLVPNEGEAETEQGEIVRIIGNIYYDIHNNGACNFDVMKADRVKLVNLVPPYAKKSAMRFVKTPPRDLWRKDHFVAFNKDEYLKFLDKFVDWAVLYVKASFAMENLEKELG